jgi:homoserine acetyltransferase
VGDDSTHWPINECRVIIAVQNTNFDSLLNSVTVSDPLKLSEVKKSLLKNPALRVYLYAGQKDVFVPVDTFTEEANELKNLINFNVFPNSGHEGFNVEQKIWNDLVQ